MSSAFGLAPVVRQSVSGSSRALRRDVHRVRLASSCRAGRARPATPRRQRCACAVSPEACSHPRLRQCRRRDAQRVVVMAAFFLPDVVRGLAPVTQREAEVEARAGARGVGNRAAASSVPAASVRNQRSSASARSGGPSCWGRAHARYRACRRGSRACRRRRRRRRRRRDRRRAGTARSRASPSRQRRAPRRARGRRAASATRLKRTKSAKCVSASCAERAGRRRAGAGVDDDRRIAEPMEEVVRVRVVGRRARGEATIEPATGRRSARSRDAL